MFFSLRIKEKFYLWVSIHNLPRGWAMMILRGGHSFSLLWFRGGGAMIFSFDKSTSLEGGSEKKPWDDQGGFKKMKGKNKEIIIAHPLDKWMLPKSRHFQKGNMTRSPKFLSMQSPAWRRLRSDVSNSAYSFKVKITPFCKRSLLHWTLAAMTDHNRTKLLLLLKVKFCKIVIWFWSLFISEC